MVSTQYLEAELLDRADRVKRYEKGNNATVKKPNQSPRRPMIDRDIGGPMTTGGRLDGGKRRGRRERGVGETKSFNITFKKKKAPLEFTGKDAKRSRPRLQLALRISSNL